ncbi:MAG: hypothetical protein ACYC0H_21150, partial [Solirubrobacteraceae bacterium]
EKHKTSEKRKSRWCPRARMQRRPMNTNSPTKQGDAQSPRDAAGRPVTVLSGRSKKRKPNDVGRVRRTDPRQYNRDPKDWRAAILARTSVMNGRDIDD